MQAGWQTDPRHWLRRSIFVDSNFTSKERFGSLVKLGDERSLIFVFPQIIVEEVYRHHDPILSAAQSLGHLHQYTDRLFLTSDARTLAPWEQRHLSAVTSHQVLSFEMTQKIRSILNYGIDRYHQENRLQLSAILTRANGDRGKFNPHKAKTLIDLCAGRIMEAIQGTHLAKKYRKRSIEEWTHGPIDNDLTSAVVTWLHKERVGNRSDLSIFSNYINRAPFLFRLVASGIFRRFILASGNTFSNQSLGNMGKFTNDLLDVEFCAFASYGRMIATADNANIATARHLHRAIELCRGRATRPLELVNWGPKGMELTTPPAP